MAPLPVASAAEDCLPYIRDVEVGSGTFANVFKGHHIDTNKVVAIKMIPRARLYNAKLVANALREAEILQKIKHPRITALVELQEKEQNIFLIMEFCSGGDLSDYRRKRGKVEGLEYIPDVGMMPVYYPHPPKGGLAPFAVRSFLVQLIDVMKFMHSHNMVHRDLKPSNIMLTLPSERDLMNGHPLGIPLLKVADFGFARILAGSTLAETLCGSPLYMAPEVYTGKSPYDSKADLWSVGCILYELSYGELPYIATSIQALQAAHRVKDGDMLLEAADQKAHSHVPSDIRNLCAILLQGDSERRASHKMVFAHEAVRISSEEVTVPPGAARSKNVALMQKLAETNAAAYEALSTSYRPLKRPEGTVPEVEKASPPSSRKAGTRHTQRLMNRDGASAPVRAAEIVPTRPAPPVPTVRPSSGRSQSNRENLHPNRQLGPKRFDFRRISSDELEREFVIVEEAPTIAINKVADELQQARDAARLQAQQAGTGVDEVDLKGGYKSWHIPDFQVDPSKPGEARRKKNYIFDPAQAIQETGQVQPEQSPMSKDHHFPPSPLASTAVVAQPIPIKEKTRSSTLSKAIQAASMKLFGGPSPQRPSTSPPLKRHHIMTGDAIPSEERELLRRLEDLSQKTHVLDEFANSRYDSAHVTPCKQHQHERIFGQAYFTHDTNGAKYREGPSWQCGKSEEEIETILTAAAEAMELYIRVMMFAQTALDATIAFTKEKETRQDDKPPSGTFNAAVQWFRHVFNRARQRCSEMRAVAGPHQSQKVELIIYNKAIELARDGGIKESQLATLHVAEEEYETALLLLCALFDDVFQEANPARDSDRITLDIYINLIKVRIAKTRRTIAESRNESPPRDEPTTPGDAQTDAGGSPLRTPRAEDPPLQLTSPTRS